jgi:hypothetical protein
VRRQPRERGEAVRLQGVQADRDPLEPGGLECLCLVRQQDAVGRERKVGEARVGGEGADELVQVLAEKRLSAGQADLVHAEAREHVHQPHDLLEAQEVLAGEPGVLLLGHAVLAAEVAAVGDRHAQAAQRPSEEIHERHASILP